ncbi:hypothetical protein TNCV_2977601 [Trichonephila clavipes]|nr:hypothetical protein TNCV_2977601 [Trichonephila clavipes]
MRIYFPSAKFHSNGNRLRLDSEFQSSTFSSSMRSSCSFYFPILFFTYRSDWSYVALQLDHSPSNENKISAVSNLKDYLKNHRVDGTRSRQDLQPQLLLVSRQYRQALKIQKKSSFSPSSPKTASPCSTTEVIPRFSPALPKRPRQHQRQRQSSFR